LLPIYPFIAVILGLQLANIFESASDLIQKIILTLSVLLPLTFAIFYLFIEPHVFDYRVSAFPKFQAWQQSATKAELYAYDEVDSRLIYYADQPIKVLDLDTLKSMRNQKNDFYLLVESDKAHELQGFTECFLNEFKPYLKKKKSLIVFGFGHVCDAQRIGKNSL